MTRPAVKPLRCAIYTRVSTDHGLEQEFNSLDAQREAAEAYVRSQSHEGWRLLPEAYDDGGFSGGTMERPGLQRLLADIEAGRIDIVVVYKVDRLTRSLADFAKLVELFDAHGVSFVSVTQAFNTTSSMGRLTLNVLLSFAQFEREVTGERIRDKIAASKKKGLWMGGTIPLGYRVEDRKLLVEPDEAATVRSIFAQYLELGSIRALQDALRKQGVRSRTRILSNGKSVGGVPLTNGPLAYLLKNRTYLGEINHRCQSYPGEHEAIIPAEQFEATQRLVARNTIEHRRLRLRSLALLIGRLRDDRGHAMSPSYAVKNRVRYRYYVSQAAMQGRKAEAGTLRRVAADAIEQAVLASLRSVAMAMRAGDQHASDIDHPESDAALIQHLVDHIVVGKTEIVIHLIPDSVPAGHPAALALAWTPPSPTRRREIVEVAGMDDRQAATPMNEETRGKLVQAIARARSWLAELLKDTMLSTDAIAARESLSERAVRMRLSLAFLAPDIVEAAIAGHLPQSFGITRLSDLPPGWTEQRKVLGLAERPR
ncbi:recombinase family protein [Bosea sp. (in: a-proteobacteria)]|uniref:recombinase family protein n=1 Tax=Bosea sp. (in: a-proteobacteria) TaxID=1871050 RepID=UPI0026299B45|nr:recombinase family protein [Bosea sp. (in: a-proteobacteria)]MCO5093601.1 recombinase family protein [Bosea sp. (in: a-proteobacteria)]